MIFMGDLSYRIENKKDIFHFDGVFLSEEKFLNLEGAIIDINTHKQSTKVSAQYSSLSAYNALKLLNVKGVGLANNHIFDFHHDIEKQKDELKKREIESCGAGKDLNEALKPALIEDDKYKYVVLSFGWNVIGCKYAKIESAGVAPLMSANINDNITKAVRDWPERKVVLYLHWNYEFEYYPQPADRRLAFLAIDAGADAVIGHHPHIVGPYEIYKGKPIFYSLGNFFMPTSMNFGSRAQTGLGIKYDEKPKNIELYWLFNNKDTIEVKSKELLTESAQLEDIADKFQDDLSIYAKWFAKNRRKKKLLPIYYSHEKSLRNSIFFKLIKMRNYIVYKLTAAGLRKRKN